MENREEAIGCVAQLDIKRNNIANKKKIKKWLKQCKIKK